MKRIKINKHIADTTRRVFLGSLVGLGAAMTLASCDDFLTITPSDQIVEEDFWQDKNDLMNGVYACYRKLITNDVLTKTIQWGELRSDNFELNSGVSNTSYRNIINANLMSTNSIFDWTTIYNEINYCNKVINHGEDVVKLDESFSENDWQPIRAEAITLRAWAHYLLVRTFGNIPYVEEDYNNDGQYLLKAQSTQIEVLDSIIRDLESVKDVAMDNYGNTVDNKGRITRKAIYSLLADVYLWRASYKAGNSNVKGATTAAQDYQSCVDCCDWVINKMISEYTESINKSGTVIGAVTDVNLHDLFIQNVSDEDRYSMSNNTTYNSIYGTGNSRESIFELQIDGTNNSLSMIRDIFYNPSDNTSKTLILSNNLISAVDQNPNLEVPSAFFTKTDYRRFETARKSESTTQTDFPLSKYVSTDIEQYNGTSSLSGMKDNSNTSTYHVNYTTTSTIMQNWMVYRLSDVVLMKAEAMSQLSADEENLKSAFSLVREVFRRSNPYAYISRPAATDSLSFESFNTQSGMENLVMAERQREFIGEGKRWFDLVRYAQRHGGTSDMMKLLTRKYGDNKKSIEAKLSSLDALFSPIYNEELKNNKLLKQNEFWGTTESTSRTDDL